MIRQPKPGQRVQLWYGRRYAHLMPFHGAGGEIVVGRARRNALVRLDGGATVTVPKGNLRPEASA